MAGFLMWGRGSVPAHPYSELPFRPVGPKAPFQGRLHGRGWGWAYPDSESRSSGSRNARWRN
jgi:hypothetical protein